MEKLFLCYAEAFRNMKRAAVRGYTAPHKPVLLLSVMQLAEEGKITTNQIKLDEELIKKFAWIWSQYVDDGGHREKMMVADGLELEIVRKYPFKCSIANPFFHMQSEPFWRLVKSDAYVKRPDYSVKGLQTCFEYAEIDPDLFVLMNDDNAREKIRTILMSMI